MIIDRIKYGLILVALLWMSTSSWAQSIDSLNHYLRIAAENNSTAKADFYTYQAAMEKLPQAGAYEDPTLEMGFYLEPMDAVGGKQVADFKVMQMFPWFGTKKAAKTEMEHMAKAGFEQFRETRNMVYLDVYRQWYILNSLQQRLKNNVSNKVLLTQLKDLATRKFASPVSSPTASYTPPPTPSAPVGSGGMSGMGGGSMGNSATATSTATAGSDAMASMGGGSSMGSSSSGMSEVLRIELEIIELDSNMETILSEMKTEKAKFNTLLNRPTQLEVAIPDTFEQVDYLFDVSTLQQIKLNNPMLEMLTEEGLSYKAQGEMNKKMSYPMLGIGVQYMLNKKTKDEMLAMGSMNGKDMIMPMVSVSIPIYRNKYKAQQRESKLWRQVTEEKYTTTVNQLEIEMLTAKHQLDDAARKIRLYDKQTELATTTYNLAVKEFVSGKNDLTNIIQVQRQLLDYKLKRTEAIANYNTMVASIQKLISFSGMNKNNE